MEKTKPGKVIGSIPSSAVLQCRGERLALGRLLLKPLVMNNFVAHGVVKNLRDVIE